MGKPSTGQEIDKATTFPTICLSELKPHRLPRCAAPTHPGKAVPKVWTIFLSLLQGFSKVFTLNTWCWVAGQSLPSEDLFLHTSQVLGGFYFSDPLRLLHLASCR